MSGARQGGYTIVEISLFLGISAMLFMIALIGTGSTIGTVRFTDSGRSLEAYVQKQYDDIVSGLNPHLSGETCTNGLVTGGSQSPGTSNCFLMGKLLIFHQNSPDITTYYIVGSEPANVSLAESDQQLVIDYAPQVLGNSDINVYSIPWQAAVSGYKRLSDSQGVNALALIRSPKSTNILAYTYKDLGGAVTTDLSAVVGNSNNLNQTTNFCIKGAGGAGLPAELIVKGSSTQNGAQIKFDGADTDCNGV